MIAFLAGLIVGASILLLILYSVARPKIEAQASVTPSALGVDLSGRGGNVIETSIDTDKLKKVFRQLEIGRG
jgi:hypothetical protein